MDTNNLKHVRFKVDKNNAPYVVTKPFHHSQKVIEQHKNGSITFEVYVHLNFELERMILGFGESIEVLSPRRLRGRIKKKLQIAFKKYGD